MRPITLALAVMLLVPLATNAETAYITDRLFVSIRDGQGPESTAIKSVASGTAVEVLQRVDGFVQVREPAGAEGWISERYLVATAPGSAAVDASGAALTQAQAELEAVRKQLASAKKSAADEARRAQALEQKLSTMEQAPTTSTSGDIAEAPVDTASDPVMDGAVTGQPSGFNFHWGWLVIAFAMLVAGFVSGVIWLREVNRKKMGGMYLRI
jgi:SH3-like domain-containing protein